MKKEFTLKSILVKGQNPSMQDKNCRVHKPIDPGWIKLLVLERANKAFKDCEPFSVEGGRGFIEDIETPINVEEYPLDEVIDKSKIILAQWGDRRSVNYITTVDNIKTPRFTNKIFVKWDYREKSKDILVYAAFPVPSTATVDDCMKGVSGGYDDWSPWGDGNRPGCLSLLDPSEARKWFENRKYVIALDSTIFDIQCKPFPFDSDFQGVLQRVFRGTSTKWGDVWNEVVERRAQGLPVDNYMSPKTKETYLLRVQEVYDN